MHMVLFFYHTPKKILYLIKINHISNKPEIPQFKITVLLNILNQIVLLKITCLHILNNLAYYMYEC